ncbi:uncharacterized protein LOC111026008 [Momordica charantia]|uniref:Uncharacterized protein LOC111026008 n=1 Tax=Momordica charantia TaxID=3673 RepID=A0A6J1DZG4_MOMCH|nr:uncharacterized protein LOC111026008 [Momordica charantia]
MDCLVLPCHAMKRRRPRRAVGYRRLKDSGPESPVTVVVGKEKRVFLVDPFVLEQNPFRVLMQTQKRESETHHSDDDDDEWRRRRTRRRRRRVILVDVDAILFEHLLWLLYNDSPSLFNLNVEEILEFYALDC